MATATTTKWGSLPSELQHFVSGFLNYEDQVTLKVAIFPELEIHDALFFVVVYRSIEIGTHRAVGKTVTKIIEKLKRARKRELVVDILNQAFHRESRLWKKIAIYAMTQQELDKYINEAETVIGLDPIFEKHWNWEHIARFITISGNPQKIVNCRMRNWEAISEYSEVVRNRIYIEILIRTGATLQQLFLNVSNQNFYEFLEMYSKLILRESSVSLYGRLPPEKNYPEYYLWLGNVILEEGISPQVKMWPRRDLWEKMGIPKQWLYKRLELKTSADRISFFKN